MTVYSKVVSLSTDKPVAMGLNDIFAPAGIFNPYLRNHKFDIGTFTCIGLSLIG